MEITVNYSLAQFEKRLLDGLEFSYVGNDLSTMYEVASVRVTADDSLSITIELTHQEGKFCSREELESELRDQIKDIL